MRKLSATAFRAKCSAWIAYVETTGKEIVITKRGKPVAKLVPVTSTDEQDAIFGFFKGKGRIKGDSVSPALSRKEWGNLA